MTMPMGTMSGWDVTGATLLVLWALAMWAAVGVLAYANRGLYHFGKERREGAGDVLRPPPPGVHPAGGVAQVSVGSAQSA